MTRSTAAGETSSPPKDIAAVPVGSPPQTLGQMVLDVAARHKGVALQYQRDGQAVRISYPELGKISTEIAQGLISLGIEPGDRVAILGTTGGDWTLADCGSLCAGTVVTPIYHTNSPEECAYVLDHSQSRLVFLDDATQLAKIEQIRDQCPMLEHVVSFQPAGDTMTMDQLRQHGSEIAASKVHERIAAIQPGDLATLVYTSGTTGPPKGCMLTHENFMATVRMYEQQLGLDATHKMYQFLPLAHVLARVAQAVVLSVGARLIYWTGDPTKIVDELSETAPTHVPAVPRIYEKIHGVVHGQIARKPKAQQKLFAWAVRTGGEARKALRERHQPKLSTDVQYRLADKLVLQKVRRVFGPDLQLCLVGAAPIAPELLEFFDACGVLVLEGYGLTETCAAAALNTVDHVRFGTVGKDLPGAETKIADDGEILLRGPHIFKGYYRDPAATEDVLTADGWLRTGDLGAVSPDGFLSITGRKKDLIITSSGKNITPVNIESELRNSRYITEAVVYGDNRPYLVAMLTLDRDEGAKLAEQFGIANDPVTIASNPQVHAEIEKDVERVNQKFARIEQIKRFASLGHDLSQAGGELTPTLKVKRNIVYEKYADVFNGLYDGSN